MSTQATLVTSKECLRKALSGETFRKSLRAVTNKHLSEERVVAMAMANLCAKPELRNATASSYLQAVIRGAETGLDFSPGSDEAYILTYTNKELSQQAGFKVLDANFSPGYQGLIELAYRSGRVAYVDAQLVREQDECDYGLGTTPFIKHVPCMTGNPGNVLFAYAVVYLKESHVPKVELMDTATLNKIRGCSKSGKSGPWQQFPGQMQRKSVLRRAFKYIPKTEAINAALQADNDDYDLSRMPAEIEPDPESMPDDSQGPTVGVAGCSARMRRATAGRVGNAA